MSTTLRELHRELRVRQCRLGTSQEQTDDFERVLHIAHEINNQLTAVYLQEAAAALPEVTPSFAHVTKRVLQR